MICLTTETRWEYLGIISAEQLILLHHLTNRKVNNQVLHKFSNVPPVIFLQRKCVSGIPVSHMYISEGRAFDFMILKLHTIKRPGSICAICVVITGEKLRPGNFTNGRPNIKAVHGQFNTVSSVKHFTLKYGLPMLLI